MRHVITPYTWEDRDQEAYWHLPNALGLVRLQSTPQRAVRGPTPQGYIFGVLPDREPLHTDAIDLGNQLDVAYSVSNSVIQSALGVGTVLSASTPLDLLWELLTDKADPEGLFAPKPLRGTNRQPLKLFLGGYGIVKTEPLNPAHLTRTIAVFQADYRRQRPHVDLGLIGLDALQRWTGSTRRKLGITADALLPTEYRGDGERVPSTTIGDTFVESSGDVDLNAHTATGPDSGFAWTALRGTINVIDADDWAHNGAADGDGFASYRADSDLATDEHSAEGNMNCDATLGNVVETGVNLRKDSTATETHYQCIIDWANDNAKIIEVTTGTRATLDTTSHAVTPGTAIDLKGQIDGADLLDVIIDASSIATVTDTSITGNLRTGITIRSKVDTDFGTIDTFVASDLVAATTAAEIAAAATLDAPPEPIPHPAMVGY